MGVETSYSKDIHTTRTEVGLSAPVVDIGMPANMLDPESLLAFFEVQMGRHKGNLNALIQQQENVNQRVAVLQSVEAKLAGHPEGIKPGDAEWEEFVAAARDAQNAL